MRAHLVQLDIAWEDRDANVAHARRLLSGAGVGEGDLIVLPELFDSGFSLNTDVTNDSEGATARAIADLAREFHATVHGSRTVLGDDGMGRNQAYIVNPAGETIVVYEKIHPFSFGREPERFAGGDRVVTYTWSQGTDSLKVCPVVCYDLRFPELFREGLAQGAQCYALGANWPRDRAAHWRALNIARAIENQAFVIAVNRAGDDPHLRYAGGSIAVDPRGEVLLEMGEAEGVGSVEIDPGAVTEWRERFPAWKDRKNWL